MEILVITHRLGSRGQDIYGIAKCEHCGNEQGFSGYDDGNFYVNVMPRDRFCENCGKNSNGKTFDEQYNYGK